MGGDVCVEGVGAEPCLSTINEPHLNGQSHSQTKFSLGTRLLPDKTRYFVRFYGNKVFDLLYTGM